MRKLRLRKVIGLPITTPLHRVAETSMLCHLMWIHLSRLGHALPVPSRQPMRLPKATLLSCMSSTMLPRSLEEKND